MQLVIVTKSQNFPHFLLQYNHKISLTFSYNNITKLPSLPLTTKSQNFPHFLSQQNHKTSSHNKTQTFPHFLSQLNLCPIISFHNSLSNFYLFPHFLSDNPFNLHNLLPTVPALEENEIKTALSVSHSNFI